MNNNSKLLLIINTIRKIIDIFLGPFLTAYLFKVAVDNIKLISIYNIYSYIVIAIFSLVIGRILKNKYKMAKNYKTKFYNLDLIISVGYRVKSIKYG